jgi:threonine dehydrogenase-like Zn-dependent dehydrogenase
MPCTLNLPRATQLAALPDGVDFESAAFATLGAISLHGFRLAQPQLGERIAVIGLGLLGLLAVGIALSAGCSVLGIDLDPRRVDLARDLGAEAVLRDQAVEAALAFSRGRGCDAVLICADTPSPDPVELAGALARDRARVVAVGAVGLHLPRKIYYEKACLHQLAHGRGAMTRRMKRPVAITRSATSAGRKAVTWKLSLTCYPAGWMCIR